MPLLQPQRFGRTLTRKILTMRLQLVQPRVNRLSLGILHQHLHISQRTQPNTSLRAIAIHCQRKIAGLRTATTPAIPRSLRIELVRTRRRGVELEPASVSETVVSLPTSEPSVSVPCTCGDVSACPAPA